MNEIKVQIQLQNGSYNVLYVVIVVRPRLIVTSARILISKERPIKGLQLWIPTFLSEKFQNLTSLLLSVGKYWTFIALSQVCGGFFSPFKTTVPTKPFFEGFSQRERDSNQRKMWANFWAQRSYQRWLNEALCILQTYFRISP